MINNNQARHQQYTTETNQQWLIIIDISCFSKIEYYSGTPCKARENTHNTMLYPDMPTRVSSMPLKYNVSRALKIVAAEHDMGSALGQELRVIDISMI